MGKAIGKTISNAWEGIKETAKETWKNLKEGKILKAIVTPFAGLARVGVQAVPRHFLEILERASAGR